MSTAVAVREQVQAVQAALQTRRGTFAAMLPKHVPVEKFVKSVMVACLKNPDLLRCDRASLLQAVTGACQLGLDPSGILGSAYIIPYGTQATLVPGYRGLIDLARRSGQILSIEAHVVRDGDSFDYELGLEPVLKHRPNLDTDKPGALRFVYAVAKLKDGGRQCEVMSRAQVEEIRQKSRAGRKGPWVDHYDEMARKTVVRRLVKWLPISTELQQALELDDQVEGEPSAEEMLAAFEQGDPSPQSGRTADLRARLEADDAREPGTEG